MTIFTPAPCWRCRSPPLWPAAAAWAARPRWSTAPRASTISTASAKPTGAAIDGAIQATQGGKDPAYLVTKGS